MLFLSKLGLNPIEGGWVGEGSKVNYGLKLWT